MIIYSYAKDGSLIFYDGSVFVGFNPKWYRWDYEQKPLDIFLPYDDGMIKFLDLYSIQDWHKRVELVG
jgi:hypothetical protein